MAPDLSFTGQVVAGAGRGRTIGVPTANLRVDVDIEELPLGVYRALVRRDDESTDRLAVVNIGHRPTVDGSGEPSVEAHILDYDEDLYGQRLHVGLRQRLREERRFDSIDELKAQIQRDIDQARRMGDA